MSNTDKVFYLIYELFKMTFFYNNTHEFQSGKYIQLNF